MKCCSIHSEYKEVYLFVPDAVRAMFWSNNNVRLSSVVVSCCGIQMGNLKYPTLYIVIFKNIFTITLEL
jgi:hypothetical protein